MAAGALCRGPPSRQHREQGDGGGQGQRPQQHLPLGGEAQPPGPEDAVDGVLGGNQALRQQGDALRQVAEAAEGQQEHAAHGNGQQPGVLRGEIPGQNGAGVLLRREEPGHQGQGGGQASQQDRQGQGRGVAGNGEAGARLVTSVVLQQPQHAGGGPAQGRCQGEGVTLIHSKRVLSGVGPPGWPKLSAL